ncbi:MAG TPA: hypothetical protein DEE98_05080 [Elusimicrobia bacterium]|nr:MAG: hypothetical protein A2278_04755 [Elusimicrobia bacterium RIFOXYA12_FULL_49_49]OGS06245.1 MAG: hypothetical protein A2204_06120 [Elusimicrobia bacterium RIFOXYA1_FULL_47_7]OGS10230.1 MAG: hypothetical protein A2386_08020 [Elusimicrobia bacterium RIFOXYB1_FULL_48_9]OGS14643.1 MAG: hypothetical protein A2251_09085 [Elusimicrobia bacterium RIFOXYA2_FULL_47_53]OGS25704.1 MAG: hypothetical protein A2339_06505 [Elusimicrobia bacterium RIFOXYB12_FULL_50_12]OGS31734.1 MAG: hypothetical protein
MRINKLSLLFALAFAVFFSSCATQTLVLKQGYDFSKVKRVAVLPFSGDIYSNSGQMVSEIFMKHLLGAGYNVVERNELDAIMKEYNLSKSGLMNPEQIKQLKLSGVDALVAGSITKDTPEMNLFENGYPRFVAAQAGITCRMIDVETGELLWAGSDTYDGMTQQTAFDYLAESIVRQLVRDIRNAKKIE